MIVCNHHVGRTLLVRFLCWLMPFRIRLRHSRYFYFLNRTNTARNVLCLDQVCTYSTLFNGRAKMMN